ncbi:hypothetical protein [Micromonospora echinofusca]|uniref:Uncharacterized protein n=1 Tax=Micromonospora echinofusca TaxID=47858 RepID=A0ABS3VSE2_MICEH|nr:hypothetical protein [Micromonospora echinofusca]MBO4207441.1 hypothetical protein [Micromonospora echinofusca]
MRRPGTARSIALLAALGSVGLVVAIVLVEGSLTRVALALFGVLLAMVCTVALGAARNRPPEPADPPAPAPAERPAGPQAGTQIDAITLEALTPIRDHQGRRGPAGPIQRHP